MIYLGMAIGVFDSGLGGLVVVKEIWKRNPNIAIVYIGDTAHVPYGDKKPDEIKVYAKGLVDKLRARAVEQIVCACNTSWAVAQEELGQVWSVTEAGKQAARGLTVGVLATTRTIESGIYQMPGQAVPGLVPLIEQGIWEGPEVKGALAGSIKRLGKVEAVVLGCTHYPLVRSTIEKLMPRVKVIDPGEELAKKIIGEEGESRFLVTKLVPEYASLAQRILGRKIEFEVI